MRRYNRYVLNEDIDLTNLETIKAIGTLKNTLLRFMKSYDVDYKDLSLYIKAAMKDAKKLLSVYKKATSLKPQDFADWLESEITSIIEMSVNDSSEWGTHWYYDDFIMDNNGYCDFINDSLNDNWGDISDVVDPRELYDNFDDYFENLTANRKAQIVNFINNIAFTYFKGNTDANWRDYADD